MTQKKKLIVCSKCGTQEVRWADRTNTLIKQGRMVRCTACDKTAVAEDRYGGVCECGDHAWANLTNGYSTIVDVEDAHILLKSTWSASVMGMTAYAHSNRTSLHREVMKPAPSEEVDHIYGDGLDNRKRHMRNVTHQVNLQNQRVSRRSSTGRRGVIRRGNRYSAIITVEGKMIRLGSFPTIDEASSAAELGRATYHQGAIER